MRARAVALIVLLVASAGSPASGQLNLQRPDDGIDKGIAGQQKQSPGDEPMVLRPSATPPAVKPKSVAKPGSSAPAANGAPSPSAAKTTAAAGSAKPAGQAKAAGPSLAQAAPAVVSDRRCANLYFAGASLMRTSPNAVDMLLQRAQIAGERHLKASPGADKAQLIQAIKMSGTSRAAEIRALDNQAGPRAAQALFASIRQCDAKLGLPVTGPLTIARAPRG